MDSDREPPSINGKHSSLLTDYWKVAKGCQVEKGWKVAKGLKVEKGWAGCLGWQVWVGQQLAGVPEEGNPEKEDS